MVGQIIEFLHDTSESKVVAPSIAAWLSLLADGFESGRLIYDPDDWGGIIRVED